MATQPVIVTDEATIQRIVDKAIDKFTTDVVIPLIKERDKKTMNVLQPYTAVIGKGPNKYGSRSFLDKQRAGMSVELERKIFPKRGSRIFVNVPALQEYLANVEREKEEKLKVDPRLQGGD